MTNWKRRILNEPLVQFIFLGALIFAVNEWWGESEVSHAPKIEVSASQVDRLAQLFERKWHRPPHRR